jgi:hypothetical protein
MVYCKKVSSHKTKDLIRKFFTKVVKRTKFHFCEKRKK